MLLHLVAIHISVLSVFVLVVSSLCSNFYLHWCIIFFFPSLSADLLAVEIWVLRSSSASLHFFAVVLYVHVCVC